MKNSFKILYVLLISLLCFSCNENREKKKNDKSESDLLTNEKELTPLLWEYDAMKDTMIMHDTPENLTLDVVLDELNNRYSGLRLDLVKTSNDTVFIKIDDTAYLAQWGSTGNYGFLAEVVYSLTEMPDFKFVNLDFEEMEHASPGLYERNDFNNKL